VKNLVDKNLTGGIPIGKALEFVFFLLLPDAGLAISRSQGIHQPGDFCFGEFSVGPVLQLQFTPPRVLPK
jgi:hypothetical protein